MTEKNKQSIANTLFALAIFFILLNTLKMVFGYHPRITNGMPSGQAADVIFYYIAALACVITAVLLVLSAFLKLSQKFASVTLLFQAVTVGILLLFLVIKLFADLNSYNALLVEQLVCFGIVSLPAFVSFFKKQEKAQKSDTPTQEEAAPAETNESADK